MAGTPCSLATRRRSTSIPSEMKVNSLTTQAKKSRGSQPPGYEVRKVLRTLEKEGLENMLPIWDDGRMIVMEGHVALVDDMKFATRKIRHPMAWNRWK